MNGKPEPTFLTIQPRLTVMQPNHNLGFWRPEDVSEQLKESILTLKLLPMPRNTKPAGFKSAWPDFVPNLSSLTVEESVGLANRIIPTAEEIDRMEKSLPDWLLLIIDIHQRKALYLRCSPTRTNNGVYSTRAVGRILGVSHQTVKNWEQQSLATIANELNRIMVRAR
ncbi:MAG: DUF6362 family protein [Candidatus Pacebacteria bacterium]|nr:DUF6362 family protein [Candidatus Paceibacterota bacterium]